MQNRRNGMGYVSRETKEIVVVVVGGGEFATLLKIGLRGMLGFYFVKIEM